MNKRRKAREDTIKILYQMDINDTIHQDTPISKFKLFEMIEDLWKIDPSEDESKEYTRRLLMKTVANIHEIDDLIKRYSRNWLLERMSSIDRNILRYATCELLYMVDIPSKVTINEAIEIAKKYGTERSSDFVNGVLDRVKKELGKP